MSVLRNMTAISVKVELTVTKMLGLDTSSATNGTKIVALLQVMFVNAKTDERSSGGVSEVFK